MSDDISPSEYYDVVGEGVRRKGELRSSKEFWDEAEKRLREPVERTIKEVDEHLVRIQEAFDRTSEDSYATRNELRADLAQFREFSARLKMASPREVNLITRVVDYGYDPEAAAADRDCGLEYVSDFELAKETYESAVERIGGYIADMERAGIEVKTGVIAVDPPGYDIEDDFEHEHEMEVER